MAVVAAALWSVPSAAGEVGAEYFAANGTAQTFETAGGAGGSFYFGAPLEIDGNTYAGAPNTQAGAFLACRSGRCVANSFDGQTFRVTLGALVAAAGAYVSGFSDAWRVRADFFSGAGLLLGSVERQGSGFAPSFAGFATGGALIERVNFVDLTSDFRTIAIDDFTTIAAPAPVPEPATWALLIAGFGLAGIGLRRSERGVAEARS